MLLEAINISHRFGKEPWLIKDLSMKFETGEHVAILGPSGVGKSTFAHILAGYTKPTNGQVLFNGAGFKSGYRPVQLVYQHPEKAVNPRLKMRETLYEGFEPDKELLEMMGIEDQWLDRYPGELSGGELQRFCIVRALGPEVRFIIADEITAMLDVITQAQIWNGLLELATQRSLGLITITHDKALAEKISHRTIQFSSVQRAENYPLC